MRRGRPIAATWSSSARWLERTRARARGRRRARADRVRGRARTAAPEARPGERRPQALRGPVAARATRSARRACPTRRSRRSARAACRRRRRRGEVDALLEGLRGDGALGLRNRALVELIYSAGLRSAEAVGLDLQDVDFEQELVHVRGKGGKERTVPLGEEAAYRLSAVSPRRAPAARARAPRTRSSSPRAASGSTRARSGGSSRTRTASATPSRLTCSRAAPTCA